MSVVCDAAGFTTQAEAAANPIANADLARKLECEGVGGGNGSRRRLQRNATSRYSRSTPRVPKCVASLPGWRSPYDLLPGNPLRVSNGLLRIRSVTAMTGQGQSRQFDDVYVTSAYPPIAAV